MASLLPTSILESLNEVCIVTPDLYKTLDGLTRLGIGPFRIFTFDSTTVPRQELRGEKGSNLFEILVAFAERSDLKEPVIEIMQPLRGQTVMQDYLDRHNNQEGVQHIAFDMKGRSIDECKRLMAERGVNVAMQGWWKGKKGECHLCFSTPLVRTSVHVSRQLSLARVGKSRNASVILHLLMDGNRRFQAVMFSRSVTAKTRKSTDTRASSS